MSEISLWSIEHILHLSTANFDRIYNYNLIENPLKGRAPAGGKASILMSEDSRLSTYRHHIQLRV